MLNSERIAHRYGSYGVDILVADGDRRVSSLYSLDGERKTTRTLATVRFLAGNDPRIAGLHQKILAGGSIGATFRDDGWQITKTTLRICERELDARTTPLLRDMHIQWPAVLAEHEYLFAVRKGDVSIDYANISEVHHPGYLDATGLRRIYGSEARLDCLQNATKLQRQATAISGQGT